MSCECILAAALRKAVDSVTSLLFYEVMSKLILTSGLFDLLNKYASLYVGEYFVIDSEPIEEDMSNEFLTGDVRRESGSWRNDGNSQSGYTYLKSP